MNPFKWMRRLRRARPAAAHFGAAAGGGLAFLSIPPIGLWPAGIAGVALFAYCLQGARARRRIACGFLFGFGLLIPGLVWMIDFTAPGYPIVVLIESSFYALAALVTPPGRGRAVAFPAALALAEAARDIWPFGGVPVTELSQGQAGSPLGQVARLGGSVLVTFATGLAAAALAAALAALLAGALARGRTRAKPEASPTSPDRGARKALTAATLAGAAAIGLVAGAYAAPDGGAPTGHLRVADVQGGGPRGLRAVNQDASVPFTAQVDATARVKDPVGLILWPENVLELDYPHDGSPEDADMRRIAAGHNATLLAGVTEPVGQTRFRNEVFAWTAGGGRIGPYEKVHRVPFGEWIPFRSLLSHVANLSDVPRDAIPGTAAGYLATPAGRFAICISWEVFFDSRALTGVRAGGRVLLVPTNAASYTSGQVPSIEIAASRLRAIATGRDVVQSAPTGYSAFIDHRGRVLERSSLGARQVIESTVAPRSGYTLFDDLGVVWVRLGLAALLLASWSWWWGWKSSSGGVGGADTARSSELAP